MEGDSIMMLAPLIQQIQRNIHALHDTAVRAERLQQMSLMPRVESICAKLLNLIYDYSLTSANTESANLPAVDYVDREHSVAVQITSNRTRAKINHVVNSFLTHRLHDTYHTLIILLLTTDAAPTLEHNRAAEEAHLQVLTLHDLTEIISVLPADKLQQIAQYLQMELGSSEDHAAQASPGYSLPPAPAPVDSFIPGSRDKDLSAIAVSLSKRPLVCLSGDSGIGKTQLALQYAAVSAPPQGAYLLPYQQSSDPKEPLRETILRAELGGYEYTGSDNDRRDEEYSQRLELLRSAFAGALLIIDGFDPEDPMQPVSGYIACFEALAEKTGLKLIVTTRLTMKGKSQHVGPLEGTYRHRLLQYYNADKHFSATQLQSVADILGYSTLILDRVARLMGRSPSRLPDLTSRWTVFSILSHLRTTIRALEPTSQSVLIFASLLPEEGLERAIFEHALTNAQKQALRSLLRDEWLEKHPNRDDPENVDRSHLAMHSYIREACLKELHPSFEDCGAFLELLWNYEQSWHWDRVPLLEHAGVKRRLAQTYAAAAETLSDPTGTFAQRSAELWKSADRIRDALHWQMQAIGAQELSAGAEPWELARSYHFTGDCYTMLREHRMALEYRNKVLQLCQERLPVSAPDLIAAHYHAGCSHLALEHYTEAAKQLELARNLQNPSLSENHPLRKAIQQQLDNAYSKLDRHKVALEYLRHDLSEESDARYFWLPLPATVGLSAFIGRKQELAQISAQLDSGTNPIIISGLPGSGKTELVAQFARSYRQGRVYYTRFDTSFRKTLLNLAESIRPPLTRKQLSLPDEERYRIVMEILGNCTATDIFIIDDLPSDEAGMYAVRAERAFKALMSQQFNLILTTQVALPNSICVEALPYEDLFQIFTHHGVVLEESRMRELIDTVNGHTLAVDLIARMLADDITSDVSPEEMLEALHTTALPDDRSADISQLSQALNAVFGMAQLPRAARRVLCCAALIPDQGIHADLFIKAFAADERKALVDLNARGWINRTQGTVTLHPVIRSTCIQELKPSDEICGPFLDALWKLYSPKEYDPERYRQMAALFAEAAKMLEDHNADHILRASTLWRVAGQLQEAKELFDSVLTKYERNLPQDDIRLVQLYNEAANVCTELGMYANALEYTMKAMRLTERFAPNGDAAIADAYRNVGTAYAALGNYQIALRYQEQALAEGRKFLSPDHPEVASAHAALGSTYGLAGDYEKALQHQEAALNIWSSILPPEHPQIADALRAAGKTLGLMGDHRRALEFQLKALAIYRKVLPQEHPDLGNAYADVGQTYRDMEELLPALQNFERALSIFKKSLPVGHPKLQQLQNTITQIRNSLR